MIKAKTVGAMSHAAPESQTDCELSDLSAEMRKVMEEEALSVSPDLVPRRAFLKRMVQVTLPAGMILATAGEASACGSSCNESSGCQPACLVCNGQFWDFYTDPPCVPCETQAVLCPNNMLCPNGNLPMGCGLNEFFGLRGSFSPNIEESQSDAVNKHLEF